MKTTRTTTLNETLLKDSEDGDTADLFIEIHESSKEDETPYRVGIGCKQIWLFDADMKKIVKSLNAAMRIRKKATAEREQ